MISPYLSILVFIGFSIFLGVLALVIGHLLSPHHPYPAKLEAYECGFPSIGNARFPVDIRYYRIAILFIIFDVETTFLLPWAVSFRQLDGIALLGMFVFLSILLVGFIFEWQRGALEWR